MARIYKVMQTGDMRVRVPIAAVAAIAWFGWHLWLKPRLQMD